jgi:SAM-dependent methyltransferase
MDDPKVLERMRSDWNERAGEDAYYYVAFGRREQDDEEFFSTAADVVRGLELDLARLNARDAALEIGCGPARLMRPLSRHFREIHGVDVSDEMIVLARERLKSTPNAFPHHGTGSDLGMFPDEKFDFVYSYAVFQHIPSKDVVFHYLREARRVLKTGGILRCQLNGLPPHAKQYDTWSGVRITPEEIGAFMRDHDFQLLALEQIHTQYMWITCRKRPPNWSKGPAIRNISNALTGEAVVPASGPLAALSLWIDRLPDECDLHTMTVLADRLPCRVIYIGPPQSDGVSQVNVALADGVRTGLVPVEVHWRGVPVCPPAWARIMPAGPSVPRVISVTDGVNLLLDHRTNTRSIKVTMVEVLRPEDFRAQVDGLDVLDIDAFCADPLTGRFEFNFRLPDSIARGGHQLQVTHGKRTYAPVGIDVIEPPA